MSSRRTIPFGCDCSGHCRRGLVLAEPSLTMHLRPILFSSALLLAACAARTPGAQPHDMSATSHETAAGQAETTAGEHAARFDADAGVRAEKCRNRGRAAESADACWTSVSNPTAEHLEHAAKLRRAAADHRAASQALRDAESRACTGLSEEQRDESPFDHREDIASVDRLSSPPQGKGGMRYFEGAVVVFRAVPGMTAEWLQRLVDCHVARNAALGHDVPEMSSCPLVPKGAHATVTATSGGFAVAIRGDDEATSREILRRAEALRTR